VKETSDQARGIIFVVLVIIITFTWMHFFQPPTPPPQKPGQTSSHTSGQAAPGAGSAQPSAGAGAMQMAAGAAPAAAPVIPVVQAAAEKTIVVESSLYRVELSNHGGVVRSWKLKKYFDDSNPPRPLDLVNSDVAQELGWPLSLMLPDAQSEAQANTALYDTQAAFVRAVDVGKTPTGAGSLESGVLQAPVTLTFHWSDGHLDVTKKLTFDQDYQFRIEVTTTLDGKPLSPAVAWLGGFGDKAIYNASQLLTVFYNQNGSMNLVQYKKLGTPGNQIQPFEQPGSIEFAGIEDQFFAAAFIPDGTDLTLRHWTQWHHYLQDNQQTSEPEAEIAVGTPVAGPLKMRAFVGPKDLAILGKVQPSLEGLVNFGWFGVIAKPLLLALQWLHHYIPNWGWAIVTFTLALTMVLLPIRIWTFRSMRRMQVIAPEMKQIQEKYKKYSMSDPRKKGMQDEMAQLYQRHDINPLAQLSGCLPILLQMPFLFAFYRVLAGAIELRHAPWVFWIHDLSVKDPWYVLPIAMAITSYLMTKMTPLPAGTDPAQQKMMTLMPLMLAFIFFRLSSGLNLYYFTSNVVGVAQQYYLNRTHPLQKNSPFKNKNKKNQP
jgi:YidC/Oxa1 family membrane protein insertase